MIDPRFELVEAQAHSSFRCVHNRCDTFAGEHPLHIHPAFELTWILRSSGTRYVGDSVERYEADDLVLSGPNLPHCWRDDPDPSGANAPEWIIVQFEPTCLGPGFLDLPEAHAVRDLLDQAHGGLAFDTACVADLEPLLRRLVSLQGLPRLAGLIDILDRLTRHRRTPLSMAGYDHARPVSRVMVERLEQVQRYIIDNLAEDISQSAIATQLGMSPATFSKFFRAATGRSFTGLVKLLRINEACRLLASTETRITAIALECGYRHTSHFDRHFLELKNMSPREYRRRLPGLATLPPRASGSAEIAC